MIIRSLNPQNLLVFCSVCASPLLGADRYTLAGTEAQNVTVYGNSFREDGSTVRPAGGRSWGEETLRWGNLKAHAGIRLSSIYDDNIIFNSPDRQKDLIWTITPTLGLGLGDYQTESGSSLAVQYEPSYVAFTDKSRFNSFDHDFRLAGRYVWSKLSIGLAQSYIDAKGSLVEIGERVRSRIYATFLGANYDYSEKTSFTLNGRQTISDYDQFNRVNDWMAELLANWRPTEKVRLSLGGAYGLRDTSPGPNEEYEQALMRVGYQATDKISFDGTFGLEFRQFQDSGSDGPGFIFGLGGTWTPREDWQVTIEGHRRDQASISNGGINVNVTGVSAIVRKQILTRYFLSLAGSYDSAAYRAIATGFSSDRRDKYWSISPSVDCHFNERWTLSVFYFYRDNESTGGGTSFNNNQVGLRTAYRF